MRPFSIIVPVFNHPDYTRFCLDSIASTSAEIIVVDNGSRQRTRSLLESYGSRISILRNDENLGISEALNRGISAASTNSIVMLHNDCIASASFEESVISVFEGMLSSKIKLVSPITNYCDEATFVFSQQLINEFVKHKLNNKHRPTADEIMSVIKKSYEFTGGIDALSGSFKAPVQITKTAEISSFCILTMRDIFLEMGGFSKEYSFRGYEDKDLLFRYCYEGYECGKASFFVHHFGNITSDGPGFSYPDLMRENKSRFLAAKQRYVKGSNGGLRPWSAVLFPDRHPELTARAKANLLNLNFRPSQIIEVPHPGIFPITKAWEWILPQVRCDILAQIDGDMLLDINTSQKMILSLTTPGAGMAAALLEDPCVGKMGHLIFWKTAVLRFINHKDTPPIDWETFYLKEIYRQGLDVVWIDEVLGQHAIKLEPFTIFKAFFRRGLKTRLRDFANASSEIDGAFKKGSPWSHIALLAFHCGIQTDYRLDPHDADFESFALAHYRNVEPFCLSVLASTQPELIDRPNIDNRIRIAILSDNLNIGGIEIIIKIIDELIDRSRFKVHIYSRTGGVLESAIHPDTVVRIADLKREMSVFRVREWIDQDRIEVVLGLHFWGVDDLFENGKTCRFIERTDGVAGWYVKLPGITDVVVFESEKLVNPLLPYPCKDHRIIHNGRHPFVKNESARLKVREELGVSSEVLICNISRLCNGHKRQSDLILMAEELVRRNCLDFKLVMMGPDQEGELVGHKAIIAQKNLGKWIVFLDGSVDGVAGLLNASDIYVNASVVEGVSGSLIEACLAGLPIVATDVGATSDVVTPANGFLVSPENPSDMASAIEALVCDKDKRRLAGAASLELAKTMCSATKMVHQFESLIEEQHAQYERDQETLLTIIIPVWNRHQFLENAIKSVIRQTADNWRLIVSIDDETPTQEIADILSLFKGDGRITSVTSRHVNQCAAMNIGMRYSRTKYAARLDSDDELPNDAVEIILSKISSNPEVGYFYSEKKFIDGNGVDISQMYGDAGIAEDFSPTRLEEWFITRSIHVWKKSDFIRAGGFSEDIIYGEDYLLPLIMMLYGTKFMPIKHPCYLCRFHDAGNVSESISSKEKENSVALVRERYRKMKELMGISWEGESSFFMRPPRERRN